MTRSWRESEFHRDDVDSLKERQSFTESRLTVIEFEIQNEVCDRCDRIAKELQMSQNRQIQDLRQEMLREVAKVPTHTVSTHEKSLLRPEAPSFTPLGDEATTIPTAACGGVEGASHGTCTTKAAAQQAPPYDGCSTWEAYRTQFEMLA